MKTIQLSIITLFCAGIMFSCGSSKQVSKPSGSVLESKPQSQLTCSTSNAYNNNIKGLIDLHCAKSCHSASKHADGIDLSSYELLKEEAVKPRFLAAIKHQMLATPMPLKAAKLSDSAIQVIECWIVNGMPN